MNSSIAKGILSALQIKEGESSLFLHEPQFNGNEQKYVLDCVETGWVSTVGSYVKLFEEKLSDYLGGCFVVAVNSGTSALHCALLASGVKSNDEVLVPTLTFVATANAVSYCGAIPHFVDCLPDHPNIDIPALEAYLEQSSEIRDDGFCYNLKTNRRIHSIVPVHVFGSIVDMDSLKKLAQKYKLEIIEDAAESLGSTYKGKNAATLSTYAAISFNGNKILTTGAGGAFVTSSEKIAKEVRHLSSTAKTNHPWSYFHDKVAYNYRMPNISAALGCGQLETLKTAVEAKRKLAALYHEKLSSIENVHFLEEPDNVQSNYWLCAIRVEVDSFEKRDNILASLHEHKIFVRPMWEPMHSLPMYTACPSMPIKHANQLAKQIICLPSSPHLYHEKK